MAMQRSGVDGAWLPQDYGNMLDIEIRQKSVAFQVSTLFSTGSQTVNFPLWTGDPTASWTAELGAITQTDATTDEVVCTPSKVAGMTRVSSELANDSQPDMAKQVAAKLSNDIARVIDAAFFANTNTNGPAGLLSLASGTVDTGAALANLDAFVDARYAAMGVGAELAYFVVSPATARTVSKLKETSTSNKGLLDFVDDGMRIAGVPVIVSEHVDAGTFFWGVPRDRVVTVLRQGTEVQRSTDSAFNIDAVDIRGIARVGFAFLHPPAVIRGYDAA